MNTAELMTRATVWSALLCYLAAILCERRGSLPGRTVARAAWTAGCALFAAHVAAAFHFYHHWSHAEAMEDTRRQTLALTGLNFSGGLYFNYLFAIVWLVDCIAWWLRGREFHAQHRMRFVVLHAFFLFMIFNATVVFGHGLTRPAGAVLCLVALAVLVRRQKLR